MIGFAGASYWFQCRWREHGLSVRRSAPLYCVEASDGPGCGYGCVWLTNRVTGNLREILMVRAVEQVHVRL